MIFEYCIVLAILKVVMSSILNFLLKQFDTSVVHGFNSNVYNKILIIMGILRIGSVDIIQVFKYKVGYSTKLLRYLEFTWQFILLEKTRNIIKNEIYIANQATLEYLKQKFSFYNFLIKALFRSDCLT